MEALESQIAKILLGNGKSASSYVYVMAEKAPVGEAELYLVAELPLFNPAAEESCERICLAMASSLKRSYRRAWSPETGFENAISQINEELGKLAALGQTQWIDKLNSIIAVKEGANFTIATSGKVSAYLLRSGELTDISCSQTQRHPLKTFENFAAGKIRLGDLILLSTAQLFNYVSMDRLLNIFGNADFLTATQTIIQLLKENAEPQISFGTLLNLQVPEGETPETEMDLENYAVEKPGGGQNFAGKAFNYLKGAFWAGTNTARVPKTGLPSVSIAQKLKNISGNTKNFMSWGKRFWQFTAPEKASAGIKANKASFLHPGRFKTAFNSVTGFTKASAKTVKDKASLRNIRQMAPVKKFFLASAVILLAAVIVNISLAIHLKKVTQTTGGVSAELNKAQGLLQNAQASLLYKDNASAANYLAQTKQNIPDPKNIDKTNKALYDQVTAQLSALEAQMEKIITPAVVNLGNLGAGNNLIKLPDFAATQANSKIVSYQKSTGQTTDQRLKLNLAEQSSIYLLGNETAVYDGSSLYIWDFSQGSLLGAGFSQNVPASADFGGMAEYPVNNRVYVADKKAAQIVSFLPGKTAFSKPVVAVRDQSLSGAVDITIDSGIYVLTKTGVNKFQNGSLTGFALQNLPTPMSASGKIYTERGFKYIYILDSGQNRILIFDKSGNLINSLKSDSFTSLRDFQVDEKNKVIYALNDGSLLKITLP